MQTGLRLGAWARPDQVELVRAVAADLGASIALAGSPVKGHAGAVAEALGCAGAGDLREVLATDAAKAVLIADAGEFGAGDGTGDAGACAGARARGVQVFTLEPIPASALDLGTGQWNKPRLGQTPADCVTCVPLVQFGRAMRHASEALAAFGKPRDAALEWTGPATAGSLGARLYGALSACALLMGEVETIDASCVSAARAPGLHALPGERLRDLHGEVCAHVRFSDARAATVFVSDQSGLPRRRVRLFGPGGAFVLGDSFFRWTGLSGEPVDAWNDPAGAQGAGLTSESGLIAEAIRVGLGLAGPAPLPPDGESALALSHAALLSARTGQPESPAMIRRLVGREP
ncbi:MAG: hypothetical protein IT439_05685 [Phycisphaerales bacterium]|nr:hypothetical protein [Phycisphaerales bacterium]